MRVFPEARPGSIAELTLLPQAEWVRDDLPRTPISHYSPPVAGRKADPKVVGVGDSTVSPTISNTKEISPGISPGQHNRADPFHRDTREWAWKA